MKPLNPIVVPRDFEIHQPSLPAQKATPKPEDNKVIGNPDRTPVNKQAALMISPIRCWLSQPFAEPPPATREQKQIDELAAQLKTERNLRALANDEIGQLRQALRDVKALARQLTDETRRLRAECAEKGQIISQLEDLRL